MRPMEFRKPPEEKLKHDFYLAARILGRVLVRHYNETSDITPVSQTYIWHEGETDSWDSGGWYLKLSHPALGEVELPMME